MEAGPCVVCGLTKYPLSVGGPTICPTCDCGSFGPQLVERQRKEIERHRAALAGCVDLIEGWAYGPLFERIGITWPDGKCSAPALLMAKALL